jgi:hypothetical protein
MSIRTLVRYLFLFDRQAILEIASDRRALLIGFLFVLSAGFAREYDGEDLLHEPWHLLIPIAASLAASFVLFLLSFGIVKNKSNAAPAFAVAYRSFLGLFWMTAPLAWLYAIPYERFMGPAEAARVNLWTLAVVAAWRVALMARVISVLMNYTLTAALFLVLAFGDALLIVVLLVMPVPLLDFMAGARFTPQESLLYETGQSLLLLGICSSAVWTIFLLRVVIVSEPFWELAQPRSLPASSGLRRLAWLSLLIWVPVLPFTQREQILKRRVQGYLDAGMYAEAVAEMSKYSQASFPPHWEPLPRVDRAYSRGQDPLLDILEAVVDQPTAPWVREYYQQMLDEIIRRGGTRHLDRARLAALLERFPDGKDWIDRVKKSDPSFEKELRSGEAKK